MSEKASKLIIYRDLEDGYRWRLRSSTGGTLAASSSGHREKATCEAEARAAMAAHPEAEILDATSKGSAA